MSAGTNMQNFKCFKSRLILVLSALTACPVWASPEFSFTFSARAEHAHPELVLDSAIAYNIAYKWNRFGLIKNWYFTNNAENSSRFSNMHCAHSDFVAEVTIPDTFSAYIPVKSHYDIALHKKVCVTQNIITELSKIEDVNFFTNLHFIEISRVGSGVISTTVEVYYVIPWYMTFLKSTINTYIQHSVEDRIMTMYTAICEE
jgi:hypothetical protein